MQAGNILLVRGSGLISWIIKVVTHSEYSHVALVISETEIIEIDSFKRVSIRKNPYSNYDLIHVLDIPDRKRDKVVAFAKAQLGKQYDYAQLLEILFEMVFHTRLYLNSKNKLICSELIDLAFMSQRINLVPGKRRGCVTPEDIAESPIVARLTLSHQPTWS